MKQTKWQRLATIGLCSSLVINAFSGVTAVAETITIESSPTVASSAKEATSASSATPASTESSQETTETSREEVTQETEKPEELREDELRNKSQIKDNNSLRSSGTRALAQMPYRAFTIYFVSEDGSFIDPSLINMSANIMTFNQTALGTDPSVYSPSIRQPISIIDAVDHKKFDVAAESYTYSTNSVFPRNFRGVSDIKITVPKKYSDLTVKPTNYYSSSKSYPLPVYTTTSLLSGTVQSSDSSGSLYELTKAAEPNTFRENYDNRTSYGVDKSPVSFGYYLGDASGVTNLIFGTTTPIYYYLTNRRVTESFKDTAGATIPAPTGFTQGKQTSITSNNYTFKQAGTLPETYKASNGKTYKFKGWYKGKTKPNTLTTTKAPSYAVTYDDNDDLNVVYEEIKVLEFPSRTYQFGFVDESGKRVDASTIDLTYDSWYGIGTEPPNNIPSAWATTKIETGIKANTKNNLKEIIYPVQYLETNSNDSFQFSAVNLRYQLPRIYKSISIQNQQGGFDAAYPYPSILNPSGAEINNTPQYFELKNNGGQEFVFNRTTAAAPENVQLPFYLRYVSSFLTGKAMYYTIQGPIYYYLTNRRVTENFVDANGTKITPPTGFTQGKQTVINSDPYTFKQSGTLPETYKASNGKTYKFKGWYKGKTKPNTLTTTKAPSYPVTYDDNDDLNVVYEEIKVFDFPALTYQFGFVDESGKRVDASTIKLTYDNWHGEGLATNSADSNKPDYWKTVSLEKGKVAPTKNNLKEIAYPAQSLEILSDRSTQYSAANLTFTLPNYYEKISVYNKSGTFDIAYPFPNIQGNDYSEPFVEGENKLLSRNFELKNNGSQSFIFNRTTTATPIDIQVPSYLRKVVHNPNLGSGVATYLTIDKPVYYYLTNRKVTENFVDTNGTKITPPTGFTQGNQIPMTSNTFKYTSAKALPASYTTGGKTYIFQGWYKGKTKPNTLTTSTTPTYNTTFDGNDDMTAMYKEEVPKASVALTRTTAETVTSGGNVTWRATITNTSQAPLTTATIKKSTAWTTGLAAPTAMIVTPAGGTAKTVPVTATTWTNGVSLGTDIPVGKSATVQFTTKATGTAGQVLRAGITTSGNYSGVSTSATVRVKDNDQAIVTPTAEGFISVPTFNFGQVGVAGSTQQHGLKKAADYYGNGTRNPYLRIKKTQPNWSLTAHLSQPKSATDSLPTATRLLLGAAPVSSFSNYNQPTELKNAVGTTSAISLNANNTATRIIANQQFTGSNIYQLDFTFNNVKLEVPANQGVKGQQYQAAITWNLVTGP
ncbi:WxL domain-containing protein [Enterococcus faecalis]|uniref:WxL domain-containing protein n=1 Tax=Enterococcus faecalis TaxID=1351 RepID=UPI001E3F18A4|nr:WxL domain-containing protein [Enterococcus faecalis]MCD5206808.1 WxL domain-containing protein [Enterococcus faecalis]